MSKLIELAHDLGVTVVAEGVEEPEQADILRDLGCDFAQGFVWSPAVPAAEFDQLLRTGLPAPSSHPVGSAASRRHSRVADRFVRVTDRGGTQASHSGGRATSTARRLGDSSSWRRRLLRYIASSADCRTARPVGVAAVIVSSPMLRRIGRPVASNGSANDARHPRAEQLGVGGGEVLGEDDELVATEPRHGVPGAHLLDQPRGRLLQHGIAGDVTGLVVDRLEPVEVAEQARWSSGRAAGPG